MPVGRRRVPLDQRQGIQQRLRGQHRGAGGGQRSGGRSGILRVPDAGSGDACVRLSKEACTTAAGSCCGKIGDGCNGEIDCGDNCPTGWTRDAAPAATLAILEAERNPGTGHGMSIGGETFGSTTTKDGFQHRGVENVMVYDLTIDADSRPVGFEATPADFSGIRVESDDSGWSGASSNRRPPAGPAGWWIRPWWTVRLW